MGAAADKKTPARAAINTSSGTLAANEKTPCKAYRLSAIVMKTSAAPLRKDAARAAT
jgi:hypothetical protein